MIRLDSINKSIIAYSNSPASSTEPVFVISYDDIFTAGIPSMNPGSTDGNLNGTTQVTVAAAPSASLYRNIKYISIVNQDIISHTITVSLLNNTQERRLIRVSLNSGDMLVFNDGSGWCVLNTSGEQKVIGFSGYSGFSGTSGYSGISGFSGKSGISGYTGVSGYSGDPSKGLITIGAGRSSTSTTNQYLVSFDGNTMNLAPYIVPFNSTIIAISATSDVSGTWSAEIHNNGTLIPGASLSLTAQTSNYNNTLNVDVLEGVRLQIYLNGTSISRPNVYVTLKRK